MPTDHIKVREEQFREAHAHTAYNHHLLLEHVQAEEQLAIDTMVLSDADVSEQEPLLESYRSGRKIRLARWRLRHWVEEVPAASKECDDTDGALFDEIDDEE
ncbi:hypothetical protein D1007_44350 [Hordeum vulgare]|nr:hypothetical protein D1007_44350 [Hordeum vulgare]